jgi:hypothetical protein
MVQCFDMATKPKFDDTTRDSIGRLSESERQRLLGVLRDLVPTIPLRPQQDVDKEIAEVRAARRSGGRGGSR